MPQHASVILDGGILVDQRRSSAQPRVVFTHPDRRYIAGQPHIECQHHVEVAADGERTGTMQAVFFLDGCSKPELAPQGSDVHAVEHDIHECQRHTIVHRFTRQQAPNPLHRTMPDNRRTDMHPQPQCLGTTTHPDIDKDVLKTEMCFVDLGLGHHMATRCGK